MKPTLKLAWINCYPVAPEPFIVREWIGGSAYYPSQCSADFMLHQWWEDESGNGEWRKIETIIEP